MIVRSAVVLAVVLVVGGCSPSKSVPDSEPGAAAPAPASPSDSVRFVDRVWKVEESASVERGQLYTFQSDGTLRIESPHGTPATGSWKRDGEGLTVTEEGIAYPVDIVSLTADEFRIRYHDPSGGTTDIRLIPAEP